MARYCAANLANKMDIEFFNEEDEPVYEDYQRAKDILTIVSNREENRETLDRNYPEYRRLILWFGCGLILFVICILGAASAALLSAGKMMIAIFIVGATIGSLIVTLTTMRRQNVEEIAG